MSDGRRRVYGCWPRRCLGGIGSRVSWCLIGVLAVLVVSLWYPGGVSVVSWSCLGGVLVVSRWCPCCLGDVLVVSRWGLGGVLVVSVVSWCVSEVSWWCLGGVSVVVLVGSQWWCLGGVSVASAVSRWCLVLSVSW